MTNEELLAAWDAGQPVTLIEMGGISPGYEMAIQITAMEVLRYMAEIKLDVEGYKDQPVEKWREDRAIWEAEVHKRIEPMDLGLSGAQWGTAWNEALIIHREGYEAGSASRRRNRSWPRLGASLRFGAERKT